MPAYCSALDVAAFVAAQAAAEAAGAPPPPYTGCVGNGVSVTEAIRKDLEPLMLRYGVDLMAFGHVHRCVGWTRGSSAGAAILVTLSVEVVR